MTRRWTLQTEVFNQGYSDAYYGKDKSGLYTGQELIEYLAGQEDFFEDLEEMDVMNELNG